jgi:NhaP-type Na+/H+ or K+/H+ antiporter
MGHRSATPQALCEENDLLTPAVLRPGFDDPALHVALALVAGVIALSLARHLRVPGIVVLLGVGILLGPDVLHVLRPELLHGGTIHTLVGFAVSVILFEGGMNLNIQRLRRVGRSVRHLVTLGALVTLVGGTLSAHWILGWAWAPSFLFGSLVIVTGPTVITPLLRRIKVHHRVATVLEAEGVLVDAIGAIFAAVALQVVVSPSREAMAYAVWDLVVRIGFGVLLGALGGFLVAILLRRERLVPEGLENIFALTLVFAVFELSNALFPESGIMTVTIAGIFVGNIRTRALPELLEFKEQLTLMLIGMLFVILAADVRLQEIVTLGWPGLFTVLALMLIVRPLNVLVGTWKTDLNTRERLFLSWLAPRGIVAAAGASLFAETLTRAGFSSGNDLRALVFLVIAVTVLVQGLTGGWVASWLGLRRRSNSGYVILGANDLGRAFARIFVDNGQETVLLESNADATRAAENEGFRVLFGSGLSETLLMRAGLETRAAALAVTSNEGINLLFAERARRDFKVPGTWVALRRGHPSVTANMVLQRGLHVLFGEPRLIELWTLRLERDLAHVETWHRSDDPAPADAGFAEWGKARTSLLPLVVKRDDKLRIFDENIVFRSGDVLYVAVFEEQRQAGEAHLTARGWRPRPGTSPLPSPGAMP